MKPGEIESSEAPARSRLLSLSSFNFYTHILSTLSKHIVLLVCVDPWRICAGIPICVAAILPELLEILQHILKFTLSERKYFLGLKKMLLPKV